MPACNDCPYQVKRKERFRAAIVCRNGKWNIEVLGDDEEPGGADWWFFDLAAWEKRNKE